MFDLLGPWAATFFLFVLATLLGIPMIARLIRVYEAKHELKHGSAGFLRNMAGWSMIAIWLLATWFFATVLGDWGMTGDLEGAIDRSRLRLQIIIEIALTLMDSD